MQGPVLILGAAGTLGSAIAQELTGTDDIVVHGHQMTSRLTDLAAQIGATVVTADLTNHQQTADLFSQFPKLAGLVFAVGQPFPHKLTHRTSWDIFQQQLDSQLKALHLSLTAAFPALKNGGRVLILSTEYVLGMPPIKIAPYVAAKAALTAYAQVIAQEWLPYGIRVHILAPGMVPSTLTSDLPQEYLDQVAAAMPEKMLTTAEDVAGIARFLLSPAADTLYGTVVTASRGVRR